MEGVIEAEGVKDDSHAWRVWMNFMQIAKLYCQVDAKMSLKLPAGVVDEFFYG